MVQANVNPAEPRETPGHSECVLSASCWDSATDAVHTLEEDRQVGPLKQMLSVRIN